ncbi:MAG: hypothetical protein V3S49_05740 [Thermodesulfobacteriota bacterium]
MKRNSPRVEDNFIRAGVMKSVKMITAIIIWNWFSVISSKPLKIDNGLQKYYPDLTGE